MPRSSGNDFGLKRFEGNQPLDKQLTADRLNTILDFICMNTVRFGRGVRGTRTLGGTTINVRNQIAQADASPNPFEVTTRTNPSNPALYQASVYWDSSLLKSIKPNDRQTITGLADAPAPTGDGNMNWFPLLGNDLIWLEIKTPTTFGIIDSATIASYGLGSNPTWDYHVDPSTSEGPFTYNVTTSGVGNIFTQTSARIPIARSVAGPSGEPIVTQLLKNNLRWVTEFYYGPTADGAANIAIFYPALWLAPIV